MDRGRTVPAVPTQNTVTASGTSLATAEGGEFWVSPWSVFVRVLVFSSALVLQVRADGHVWACADDRQPVEATLYVMRLSLLLTLEVSQASRFKTEMFGYLNLAPGRSAHFLSRNVSKLFGL